MEFRLWDGSLDPAVIQTRVKVCLALVDHARRGRSPVAGFQRYGEFAGRPPEAGEQAFTDFRNTFFPEGDDGERVHRLFDITAWQRGT